MTERPRQDPELSLLLEDFDKRPGYWLARAKQNGAAAPAPYDGSLRLLIEDFEERPRGWLSRFRPAPPAPPSEQPLHLLLDEFDERPRSWLRDFRPASAPPPAALEGDPELDLLLADYNPAARIADRFARAAPAPAEDLPAPDLLLDWDEERARARSGRARAASIVIHIAWIVLLVLQPRFDPRSEMRDEEERDYTRITLLAPSADVLRELTQKAPPKPGPKEAFRGEAEAAQPAVIAVPEPLPAPPVPEPAEAPPQPIEPPEPAAEPPAPAAEEPAEPEEPPEPKKPVAAQTPNPGEFRRGRTLARSLRPEMLPAPRAPSKSARKPKLTLEDPKAVMPGRTGRVQFGSLALNARPDEVIEAAIRKMAQSGGGGRQAVGEGVGGAAQGVGAYLPPSPGNVGSGLELLSDPKGVDFRPYLTQILAAVRRNWYAVIPESARLGMNRGRVAIQFSIARDGNVPKLVIADSSGVHPLDRASVAGISASLPFPPLPTDYSGSIVRLQFVFQYNMKTR